MNDQMSKLRFSSFVLKKEKYHQPLTGNYLHKQSPVVVRLNRRNQKVSRAHSLIYFRYISVLIFEMKVAFWNITSAM